jgi:hypothetical protein
MKSVLLIILFTLVVNQSNANQNNLYVASKEGITIIAEGGWDTAAEQKQLNADLDFIITNLNKPKDLKILIILGAYGMLTHWRSKIPKIFISAAYDNLTNTDTLYDEKFNPGNILYGNGMKYMPEDIQHPNELYVGDSKKALPFLKGNIGLKIEYYDIWDTVDYYNHLLSVVDYSVKNIDEIKKKQRRICLEAYLKDWEISILTYDTAKLKMIAIKDWGFTFNPSKRSSKKKLSLIYPIVSISIFLLLMGLFIHYRNNKKY